MNHNSPLNLDYERLNSLLSSGQWKEADNETNKLIEEIEETEKRREDFIASEDIKIIDELWTQASNGRFGFSPQVKVYKSLGGKDSFSRTNKQIWENFCDEVGWNEGNPLDRPVGTSYSSHGPGFGRLMFGLDAPYGHLPSFIKPSTSKPPIWKRFLGNEYDSSVFIEKRNKFLWNLQDVIERLK